VLSGPPSIKHRFSRDALDCPPQEPKIGLVMFWREHLSSVLGLDFTQLAMDKSRRDVAESLLKGVFKRVFVQGVMKKAYSKQMEQKCLFIIHHNDTFHRQHRAYSIPHTIKHEAKMVARKYSDLLPEPWETYEDSAYRRIPEHSLCHFDTRAF